jgi:hypothetical protein
LVYRPSIELGAGFSRPSPHPISRDAVEVLGVGQRAVVARVGRALPRGLAAGRLDLRPRVRRARVDGALRAPRAMSEGGWLVRSTEPPCLEETNH